MVELHFTTEHWVSFVVVGVMAAFFVGYLMRGRGFGLLGNLAIGVLGALIGPVVYALIMRFTPEQYDYLKGLPAVQLGDVAKAMIGAFLLLLIVGFLKKREAKA